MSSSGAEADAVCANCGIAGIDDIKLEDCDGCDLVKYCSDKCQENHRKQHEQECSKRKVELDDKQLFTQPGISYLGECPICFLPLSLDPSKSTLMGCCCKILCDGCANANRNREIEAGLEQRCAFCREPVPESEEEYEKRLMKRIKENDPVAMTIMGKQKEEEGDFVKALQYYTNAVELGDVLAYYRLGNLYDKGNGVEEDTKKAVYHWEQAAIGGHPNSRALLAAHEMENGNIERAVKHLIINANLGHEKSMKWLWECYKNGDITKEDLEGTLRTHQAAIDEMKSPEREAAEKALS